MQRIHANHETPLPGVAVKANEPTIDATRARKALVLRGIVPSRFLHTVASCRGFEALEADEVMRVVNTGSQILVQAFMGTHAASVPTILRYMLLRFIAGVA